MTKNKNRPGLIERFSSGLDRLIGVFSPEAELKRRMFRFANNYALKGSYAGASRDRLRSSWIPYGGSADEDLLPDLNDLRERSRDLARNDGVASGIISSMVSNVVGHGIVPQCQLDKEKINLSDDQAEKFQKDIESAWELWGPFADTAGRMSFWEIQQLVQSQVLINGEAIIIREMVDESWRPYSLAFNVIESDRMDTPSDKRSDRSIRRGVEIGSRGEPLAYWICKTHPGDVTYTKRHPEAKEYVRFPVRNPYGQLNVLHLYWVKRPGQTRGEPFFSPVLLRFRDLADYMEAELVSARVAACFSVFIKKTNAYTAALKMAKDTQNEKRIEELEPGFIDYLGPDEDISVVNPNRPGAQFDPFVDKVIRFIGAGLNLPYELVMKDFSKSNYSSARAAILEARKYFKSMQVWTAQKLCQPIWELFSEEAFLRGYIEAPDFYQSRSYYCRAKWIAPGWGYIDPEKEINASIASIRNNLSTHADEIAAHGKDWEDVFEQLGREKKKREELGLPDGEGGRITLTATKENKKKSGDENVQED